MNFIEIIEKLNSYWSSLGANIYWPHYSEKGAATANPLTFFGALNSNDCFFAHIEECKRPQDGRYGKNPNRLYSHHQYQVFIKPAPVNIESLYLESLCFLGLDIEKHDIKFLEDDWSQPTLGAWGLGSEVVLNGIEVTQFTYFNQVGGISLSVIPIEITYGLERLALAIQQKSSVMDLDWDNKQKYRDVCYEKEYEFSKYTFEVADTSRYLDLFKIFVKEAENALEQDLPLVAYDMISKSIHIFNILDARNAISANERQSYIQISSSLANRCCKSYISNKEQK
jgi:glycyl-tRNA synthetase alpha chain